MAGDFLYDDKKVFAVEFETTHQTYADPDLSSVEDTIKILRGASFPIHGEVLEEDNYPGDVIDRTNSPYLGKEAVELSFSTYLDFKDDEIHTGAFPGGILKLLASFLHATPVFDTTNNKIKFDFGGNLNKRPLSIAVYEDGVLKKYKSVIGMPVALKVVPGQLMVFDWKCKAIIEGITTTTAPTPVYWGDTKIQDKSSVDQNITDETVEEWTLNFEGDINESGNGARASAVEEFFASEMKFMLNLKTRLKAASREGAVFPKDEMIVRLGSNPAIKPYFSFSVTSGTYPTGKIIKRESTNGNRVKMMDTEIRLQNLASFDLNFTSVII